MKPDVGGRVRGLTEGNVEDGRRHSHADDGDLDGRVGGRHIVFLFEFEQIDDDERERRGQATWLSA